MEFEKIKVGDKVWTMIGNYPYEVEVIRLSAYTGPEPRGTFQNDHTWVWRSDKGTTHERKSWDLFQSEEDIKNYLFPPKQ